jgi:ketosteroid isomerase-like protein
LKVPKKVVLAATILLAIAGSGPASAGDTAVEKAVREGTAAWIKAYNAGNVDVIVATYAADALMMPPGSPAVRGQAAIREFIVKELAGARAAGVTLALGTTNESGTSGDLAWHTGSYSVVDRSGTTVDSGSYLEVWQKTGGKWLIVRDMWNSDRPSPPPAAPSK